MTMLSPARRSKRAAAIIPHCKEKKEVRIRRFRHSAAVSTALLFMVLLAACGGATGTPESAGEAPAAGGSGTITGNVVYLDRSALDPNAVIEVDLLQSSAANGETVIATTSI